MIEDAEKALAELVQAARGLNDGPSSHVPRNPMSWEEASSLGKRVRAGFRSETPRPVGWARPQARVLTPQGPGKVQCSWAGNKIIPDRKVSVLVDGPNLSSWEFFESELAPETGGTER